MNLRSWPISALFFVALAVSGRAQVIDFESGGLKYRTLSKNGITVMFAHLPAHVREWAILQVAVSNGSKSPKVVGPEDCRFLRPDGTSIRGAAARSVVDQLITRGNRNDVIKLVSTYESGLYGNPNFRSTNGYELRRQAALAEVSSTKLKAAAAASAIALVDTKLNPGESTDGAVFFPSQGKPLGSGQFVMRVGPETFQFDSDGEATGKILQRR